MFSKSTKTNQIVLLYFNLNLYLLCNPVTSAIICGTGFLKSLFGLAENGFKIPT